MSDESRTVPVLLLVDGHSLAYRAFFAYARGAEGGLRTSEGIPTSITFGFLKTLLEVIEREKPTFAALTFDTHLPTFRHEVSDTYKAGRQETPAEFFADMDNLRTLLGALDLPQFELPGYEADDLIGTLAVQGMHQGYRVKILSGDQDLFQLVNDPPGDAGRITVLHQGTRTTDEFGPQEVKDKLGITPGQVIDYKALCGDSSDNIKGVRGIGAKTAIKLLEEYGSLENLLQSLDRVGGAVGKKLQEGIEDARGSYFMATIETKVPLVVDFEACRLKGFNEAAIRPLFEKLELRSFLNRLPKLQRIFGGQSTSGTTSIAPAPIPNPPGDNDDDLWFFSAETAPKNLEFDVRVVQTPEAFDAFIETLRSQTGVVAWDTETTSIDPLVARLVGIGCAWSGEIAYYLPISHLEGVNLDRERVLATLGAYFADPGRPKTLQNAKYDRLVLKTQGLELEGVVFDPMLASYVLDPEGSHGLQALTQKYLRQAMGSYEALVPKGQTIDQVSIELVSRYCGADVVCTWRLVEVLQTQLDENPRLAGLFKQVEMPLEQVLACMEFRGILIDRDYLKTLEVELRRDLATLEQEAYALAGATFNLGSPKQMSDLLFNKLGLSIKKSRKTSLGYSTDAATLEKLRDDHPIVEAILNHRILAKLKSTYVEALPQLVVPHTGRVHTDFNQTVTTTGRLSSSNPNLQNIPVRTSFSRRIRRAFVPEPGWLLMAADYSQIELRILTHLTQEEVLVQGFRNGEDVHTLTARLLLNKPEVTADERRLAKTINYGVVYGMGARRFAREAGVGLAEAETFIKAFYKRYPAIFTYFEDTRRQVIEHGYVETLLGRRRYFRGLADLNQREREAAMRAAVNAPIQGTAADIVKLAMIRVEESLRGKSSRLLLQVHDELVLEVQPDEKQTVELLVRTQMEQVVALSVPLAVEINSGVNWMEAK